MASTIGFPAFLQQHIDTIAQNEGIFDYTLDTGAGSKHGDGFMADIVSVSIKGSTKNKSGAIVAKQLSLICKLLPENKARQDLFSGEFVFEREVHFYKNILPILKKVQDKHQLTEANGFFSFPHCYAAEANAVTKEYVIIMQDLKKEGFTLWNKFDSITYDKVHLLFVQLGRLHGLSFVMRDEHPELFPPIQKLTDIMMPLITSPTMKVMFERTYDKAIEVMENAEHKQLLVRLRESWVDILKECLDGRKSEPFAVLGHGDCWNNNMMFSKNNICILDWQICRYVSPVLDLAYYFFSSTDKELRDKHYDNLIQTYYDSLCAIRQQCTPKSKQPFTLADLNEEFRKFGKYGMVMAPVLLSVIVSDPSNISDLNEMSDAIQKDEADAENLFAVFDADSSVKYRQRLGDVIDDAKRLGWI